MADNKCRWGLVRTDCHEFVTEEQLLLDEFLAQVREAIARKAPVEHLLGVKNFAVPE